MSHNRLSHIWGVSWEWKGKCGYDSEDYDDNFGRSDGGDDHGLRLSKRYRFQFANQNFMSKAMRWLKITSNNDFILTLFISAFHFEIYLMKLLEMFYGYWVLLLFDSNDNL